jgi:NitT/TauT family transport system substrate-binding protein
MLLSRPGIDSLAGLAGKRIGVEQSALGALLLHKVLAEAKLPKSALTIVPMNIDGHLDAWRREGLDALITYEPTATRLLAEGARRLYDSRSLPNTIFDVLAVMPEAAARHPQALAALVAGHFQALRHLRHNPQDAAYRMAGRMGIPAGEVLNAYRGLQLPDLPANRRILAGGDGPLLEAARELEQVMREAGLLDKAADLEALARADFLPSDSA